MNCLILAGMFLGLAFGQFSPGELSQSHGFLNGNEFCDECHSRGKTVDDQDCLNCHKPIATRIRENRGFHGKNGKSDCHLCHSDHNGARFSMIHWDIDKFDHSRTGYDLSGKHSEVKCRDCHKNLFIKDKTILNWESERRTRNFLNTTFLGLREKCENCHENVHHDGNDLNSGSLFSQPCTDCHNTVSWAGASKNLDHSRTGFQLEGSHTKIKCIDCHKSSIEPEKLDLSFRRSTANGCIDCHTDEHKGSYGYNCKVCHDTNKWKETRYYDHTRTGYPLIGRHLQVKCISCHQPGILVKNPDTCKNCHDDVHKEKFGKICRTCHTENGWKEIKSFDHNSTNFPLTGSHINLDCKKCHSGSEKFVKTPHCRDCHNDIHGGQFFAEGKYSSCSQCHSTVRWKPSDYSFIQHNESAFPLLDAHLAVPCIFCHKAISENKTGTVLFSGLEKNCRDCHEDVHYRQFSDESGSTDCSRCHTPSNWRDQLFDHNSANFKLDGSHVNLSCGQCHFREYGENSSIEFIRYTPIPHTCMDCHLNKFRGETK